MRLRVHDPGQIGLRRAVRAAIALPLVMVLMLVVLDSPGGALFAAFGTIGLLVQVDFAGGWRRRVLSYLVAGVVGTAGLLIGWAASGNPVSALLVTTVVAFLLSIAGVLRGTIAAGTPAVLLVYIVAVTAGGPPSRLPSYLLGWWVAVLASTFTAWLILPRERRQDIRRALADSFTAAARWVDLLTAERPSETDSAEGQRDFHSAVDHLHAVWAGKPFRPAGTNAADRALTLLIAQVTGARLLFADGPLPAGAPGGADLRPSPSGLAEGVVSALRDLAAAMTDRGRLPSAAGLVAIREGHRTDTESWVAAREDVDPQVLAEGVRADHALRMAAVLTEQMVGLGRMANGGIAEAAAELPPIPERSAWAMLRAQATWRSPWFRNALRSSIGLGLAMTVVEVTGVQHGFWVLLGVVSILRFDALGTRRSALQAIGGTVTGVLVATAAIYLVGQDSAILWLLLPPVAFFAAWSTAALGFAVGQAAFSGFVILMLAIIEWPPDLMIGLVRIEDVAIGAAVALVVGVLLWPHGALGALHAEVATSLRRATAYLSIALDSFARPVTATELDARRVDAVHAALRADETYDLAVMQRGPAAPDTERWAELTNAGYLMITVARLLSGLTTEVPVLAHAPELADSLKRARDANESAWNEVATGLVDEPRSVDPTADPGSTEVRLPARMGDAAAAHAFVVTLWAIDWVEHVTRLAIDPDLQQGQRSGAAETIAGRVM